MSEHLVASEILPKIVITEPSPGISTDSAQNVVPIRHEVDAVAPVSAPEPQQANFQIESTEDDTAGSSISPSVSDIDSCSVEMHKATAEPRGNGLLQVPAEPDEEDDDNDVDGLRNVEDGAYDLCWRWLQGFSDSKFMFPILTVLLIMPISAGFMGARYMDRCPLSSSAPLFLFMLGVLGTLVILCRMASIACSMCSRAGPTKTLGMVVVFGNLAILLLLCTVEEFEILEKYDINQNNLRIPEEDLATLFSTEGDTIQQVPCLVEAKKLYSNNSVGDISNGDEVLYPDSSTEELNYESRKREGFPKLTKIKKRTVTEKFRSVDSRWWLNFLNLYWTACATLYLFVVPVLMALLSGMMLHDSFDSGDPHDRAVALHFMLGFTGTALVLLLPLHLMSLEDAILEAISQEDANRSLVSKTTTVTTYYYGAEKVEEMG